ncbi:MAG: cupin domain-containing protein [Bacteroidales bacterium]
MSTKSVSKVNVKQKLQMFNDYWNPRIVGELNNQQVKLAKFKGEFVWHKHEHEDELFYVIDGTLQIELKDKTIELTSNEFVIIPRGVEHRPVALNEVSVMLFEPSTTLNTGNERGALTHEKLEKL